MTRPTVVCSTLDTQSSYCVHNCLMALPVLWEVWYGLPDFTITQFVESLASLRWEAPLATTRSDWRLGPIHGDGRLWARHLYPAANECLELLTGCWLGMLLMGRCVGWTDVRWNGRLAVRGVSVSSRTSLCSLLVVRCSVWFWCSGLTDFWWITQSVIDVMNLRFSL